MIRDWRKIWPWVAGGALFLLILPRKVVSRGVQAGLVAVGWLTSLFGEQRETKVHQGIDIKAPEGTEVRAAAAGTVVDVSPNGWRSRYGNTVIIDHVGPMTLYAHLVGFGPGIRVGRQVQAGDVIGYVGGTALPDPPAAAHLHFEVLKQKVLAGDRIVVNPETPERYEPRAWLAQRGRPLVG